MIKVLAYGVQQTVTKALSASKQARVLYVQGSIYEAEKIMTESLIEVPVDTGRLKNSKFINHDVTSNGVVSTLGYRALYALPVHEIDRPHAVGKSQYLRDPLNRAMPGLAARVADYVAKALG